MDRTVKDALLSGKLKLRQIAEVYDDESVSLFLETWLVQLARDMGFQISEAQARETAILLLEEIYMLNLSELTLLFKKIRKGDYGTFYGSFNMQTIVIAAKRYRQERGKEVLKLPTELQQKIL